MLKYKEYKLDGFIKKVKIDNSKIIIFYNLVFTNDGEWEHSLDKSKRMNETGLVGKMEP